MQRLLYLTVFILLCVGVFSPVLAVEGPSAAGPIGGTDIRSALMPPPGFYAGTIQGVAATIDFLDGQGNRVPSLQSAHLTKELGGPFFYAVPDIKALGGSIGLGGFFPAGNQCGHLFANTSGHCQGGIGDPYVEVDWSRYFGTPRASKYSGAYPILEGLAIMVGLGAVVPLGGFEHSDPLSQALSIGNNIWDVAPNLAVTYTTTPILAEGTEISAKFYWNKYFLNPATNYLTGDLIDLDFAVTEHIGRFQLGPAGNYAVQVKDDEIAGRSVPPDGRRGEILQLGGVLAYDLPEYDSSVKAKATATVFAANTVSSWVVVVGWVTKF